MAGAGNRISVETDDAALRAALVRMTKTLDNPKPVLDEIGGMLVASTLDRFERGQAPDGSDWQKSARAEAENGQTLVDTGRLRGSITHRASGDAVEVGTNVVYAAIHQFGGRIEAKNKKALSFPVGDGFAVVESVTMPARPFLGLNDADRSSILRIVERAIERATA